MGEGFRRYPVHVIETGLTAPPARGLAFSPDGRWLAALSGHSHLAIIDTQAGSSRTEGLGEGVWPSNGVGFTAGETHRLDPDHITAVAVTPDGRVIFAARRDVTVWRTEILRWDAATREPLGAFGGHGGQVVVMAVSADGSRVAGAGGKHARVWNVSGGSTPGRAACHVKVEGWVKALALSKDGGLLATVARKRVQVWDAKAGAEKFRHSKHNTTVQAVALAPTRPLLMSGGNDGLVFVYDASSGREVKRLDWSVGPVVALAFAPDGLRCAAAGKDGKVVIWDVDA